jgi:signal transduction histidine kinase
VVTAALGVPPPPPRPRFAIRPIRRTVRLRLTVLYIGLFLACAAGLLLITYLLVARQLPQTLALRATGAGGAASGEVVTGGAGRAGSIVACGPLPGSTALPDAGQLNTCLQQAAAGLRGDTLEQLLIESGIALGIMSVVSVGLGWLMAGRVLRPLRTITATARRISARSLHQRIAMTGPDDELKELGDTFDQLLGRLDASFAAQRQFVANASHELRTPLARQRTLLEVALRDPQASVASLRAACERALAAGEQQERLIAALLTLARGERGLDTFEAFDLGAVAASALDAQRDDAADHDLAITADLASAGTAGDPRLAERLAANLVDNAIRYNAADGRVEIVTGTRNGRPFLAVTNTGPVVPADQLARLFQPFQRLDPARTGPGPAGPTGTGNGGTGNGGAGNGGAGNGGAGNGGAGSGLGLAIVSAIAAAHGAELRASAPAAGGLVVEVIFPPRAPDRAGGQGGVSEVRDGVLV